MAKRTTKTTAPLDDKAQETKTDATSTVTQDTQSTDAPQKTDAEQDAQTPAEPVPLFDQVAVFCARLHGDARNEQALRALWDDLNCDELAPKLAVATFDCALNQGAQVAQNLVEKIQSAPDFDDHGDEVHAQALIAWRLRRYAFSDNPATHMRNRAERMLRLHSFILTGITSV